MGLYRPLIIAGIIGMAVCTPAETKASYPYYDQRTTLFDVLPVDSTNIVFLGNSLTDNCEWAELLGNPKVLNRGIGSDVAEGVYARLDQILKGHPAKIFLLIGINDVSHDLTAEEIAAQTERIVERIIADSPGTQVYLQSLLPIDESLGYYKALTGKTHMIPQVNTLYRSIAERKGVTYVDLYSQFVDNDGTLDLHYSNDGLHLNGGGYLLWKEILQPYLK